MPGFGFKFDYIAPQNPIVGEILAEKCPNCDPRSVPGSGPAPVLMRFSDLRAATPLWEELSEWIETHEHAKKALGEWDQAAEGRVGTLGQHEVALCFAW